MTRALTLCLVIVIVLTSATACRRAWRASRPVRGGTRVVREISRTQDQTNRTAQTPTPTHADLVKLATQAAPTPYAIAKPTIIRIAETAKSSAGLTALQTKVAALLDAVAYVDQGNAKARLGDYEIAITDYDEAIKLQPDNAAAYYNRGLVKAKLGDYAAAIADFDEAIRLQPDLADAYDYRDIAKRALEQTE